MKQYNKSIKGKIFKYLEDRLSIKKSTKGWWRCNCPYCGGNYSFGVNFQSYRAKCFKCDEKVSPAYLVMYMEGFETTNQLWKFMSIQQEYDAYERRIGGTEAKIEVRQVELPESYNLISEGNNMIAQAARHYLKKRGFNLDKLATAGVGYCDSGEYDGYIIFPYYKQGNLIYYQGRLFMGSGPKMKNPMEEQFGIGKTQIIYNEDALYIYNKVYVVESITNALTLGDNAIALSGKKASDYQIGALVKSPCTKLVIILDDDARIEAIHLAMQMVHFKSIKLVWMPEAMDVNDMGREATREIVKNTQYLLNYGQLLKLKNEGPKYTS